MNSSLKPLKDVIENLVFEKEKSIGFHLHPDELEFLIDTCAQFVTDNIHKFVSGGKEHADADFFNETEFTQESWKEILDLANYIKAIEWKKRK